MLSSVKISDLSQKRLLKSDLFLKVKINYLDEAKEETDEVKPYDTTAVELSAITDSILQRDRVVKNKWVFSGPVPTESARLDPTKFFNDYILDKTNRKSVIASNGNYQNNSTFFSSAYSSTMLDSSSVSQYAISNIDYVNRLAACLFDYWMSAIEDMFKSLNSQAVVPSTIGECIFSTTLSNKDAVKRYYGDGQRVLFSFGTFKIIAPNTDWIQHSGDYFFGDWSETPTAGNGGRQENIGTKTKTVVLTKSHLKKHHHTISEHSHSGKASGTTTTHPTAFSIWKSAQAVSGGMGLINHAGNSHTNYSPTYAKSGSFKINISTDGSGDQTTSSFGNGYTLNIEQKYKKVYVWERIS